MGTNCAPLLADLFLYSYESEIFDSRVDSIVKSGSFNRFYRYIDDDLIVFNKKNFIDYVKDIYPSELNAEKANKLDDQANYLDSTFIIGNNNRLFTILQFIRVGSDGFLHFIGLASVDFSFYCLATCHFLAPKRAIQGDLVNLGARMRRG